MESSTPGISTSSMAAQFPQRAGRGRIRAAARAARHTGIACTTSPSHRLVRWLVGCFVGCLHKRARSRRSYRFTSPIGCQGWCHCQIGQITPARACICCGCIQQRRAQLPTEQFAAVEDCTVHIDGDTYVVPIPPGHELVGGWGDGSLPHTATVVGECTCPSATTGPVQSALTTSTP